MPQPRGSAVTSVGDRIERRIAPIVATVALVVLAMVWVRYWNGVSGGDPTVWRTPPDIWLTYYAAVQAVHGHFANIYAAQSALVAFPGIVVVLAPVAALTSALGLQVGINSVPFVAPTSWYVLGPYLMVCSSGRRRAPS